MSDSVLSSLKSLVKHINLLNEAADVAVRLRLTTVVNNDGIDNASKVYIDSESFDIVDTRLILEFINLHSLALKVVPYNTLVRFVIA